MKPTPSNITPASTAPANAPPSNAPLSLDQLRDLHLPDPVGFWPPAPGWWLLGLLLLGGLCALGYALYQRRKRNAYRRAALAELAQIRQQWQQIQSSATTLSALSALLRRTALAVWPREQVAGLPPAAWRDWLAEQSGLTEFRQTTGILLTEGVYQPQSEGSLDAALALTEQWIKHHRRPPC